MNPPRDPDRPAGANGASTADETVLDLGTRRAGSRGHASGGRALEVALATDVGRVRRINEDYVGAALVAAADGREFGLWLVADGVGGGPRGEHASRLAVETVIDTMTHDRWADPARALTNAFAVANRNVFDLSGNGATSTTLVVALVCEADGAVFIANVGDSRAYLVSGGEAKPITDDHSVVAARVAAGHITAAEARTAPDRNVLTRSVGSEREVLVDLFGPRQLLHGERLVLCSDGIHGMIDDTAIARIVDARPIADAAGALVVAAVDAGGRDNATALVGGRAQLPAQEPTSAPGAESQPAARQRGWGPFRRGG